jgi:hypothetical protein
VNPKSDEEVFCLGVRLAHSLDGGKTFSFIGGQVNHISGGIAQGLHLDQCELWIDPSNSNHLALGNDGGFYVSYDKGSSWTHYNNIPTGEFYDITIDKANYLIYGGTQDDATVYGPPKELNTKFPDPWKYLWIDPWDGGDGCVTQIDPNDPSIIYYSRQHGDALRLDKSKDVAVSIMPTLPKGSKDTLVFNYMTPYFLSMHSKNTLYHGGNYVLKSTNRGDTWNVISPNLSLSSDQQKNSFATGTIAESPLQKGLLYAGTDHGGFWVSQNDGKNWQEYSSGLANNYIRSIAPSQFKVSRVYLAMTGINYDDLHSYLYCSEDHGKSWRSISAGLPDEPVNVIKEDVSNENILYAGGLRGVYVSLDRGTSWSYLGTGMPATAISDLEIHTPTKDLIAATHGRGIYKINLKSIQQKLNKNLPEEKDHLFEIGKLMRPWFNSSGGEPDYRTVEKSSFTYWLSAAKKITLAILGPNNKEIWKTEMEETQGLHEFRWDPVIKRESSDYPYFIHYDQFIEAGTYTLRLSTDQGNQEQRFTVTNGISPYVEK